LLAHGCAVPEHRPSARAARRGPLRLHRGGHGAAVDRNPDECLGRNRPSDVDRYRRHQHHRADRPGQSVRRRGLSVAEAVVEGGRLRVRPIVMTAISTVGALTPIALGLGSSSMLIAQSLAIVTIGGLVSSTLLSLAIIPALYTILEETKQRWSERRGRRGK